MAAIAPDAGWTATTPAGGSTLILGTPGSNFGGTNFGFRPPTNSSSGVGQPGSILGVVFSDAFDPVGRGLPAIEPGVSGVRVFADDGDGVWEAGEPYAFTQSNGAFFLADVGPGTVHVTIEVPQNYAITTPAGGVRDVNLASDGVTTNALFGIRNLAINDWGDLAGYPTTLAENGPRHFVVPGFQLGAKIDGEADGQPTADATGDDVVMGDEDGVTIISNGGKLQPGINTLSVTVSGVGGYLNGWVDLNNDGDWTDPGEQVFVDLHLNEGPGGTSATYNLQLTAPGNMAGGPLAARFRWGSAGNSYTGADVVGEVEDYRLANSLPVSVVVAALGDYNRDNKVDQDDYLLWKDTFGSHVDLAHDGNNDGQVDAADYTLWRNNKGAIPAAAAASGSSLLETTPRATLEQSFSLRMGVLARGLTALVDQQYIPTEQMSPELAAYMLKVWGETRTIDVGGHTITRPYFYTDDELAAMAATQSLVQSPSPAAVIAPGAEPQIAPALFGFAGLQFETSNASDILASAAVLPTVATPSSPSGATNLDLLDGVWSVAPVEVDDITASTLDGAGKTAADDATDLAMGALFEDELAWAPGI